MKKIIALALAMTLALGTLAGCGTSEEAVPSSEAPEGSSTTAPENTEEKVLNIFTWDGYFPPNVLEGFTAETGIEINLSHFETNEEMLIKLQATDGGDYDLVIASDYIIDIARKQGGLLADLDRTLLPNFENLDEAYLNQFFDPNNVHTIPYSAGTPLILYNDDVVDIEIKGYNDLWDPSLVDSIAAMDDGRNVIGMTLKSMGKSLNETDPAVLAEASTKLMELKPNIRMLTYNNLQTVLLTGEASVAYMFSSQAAMALAENPELKVVYPEEGMGFGIDSLFVPKNAPHSNNAHAFMNYIMDAEVGASVSSQIMYLCPNKASAEFLPAEYTSNAALFIPSEELGNTEFMQDVGEATATFDKIWTEFKQS